MIGRTLAHFRILAKIGEGGMGVVYRAEDTDLRRPVALKVLPPDLVGNEERRLRFLREARAAAAVTHPNIATIHEVGQAEGVVFIAMELVEGRTLREQIGGRPMPIKDALRIATEMAEGLVEAHKAGVIHRDLKPDNVIVHSNGHAKILDFGLAKLLEERADTADDAASKMQTISGELTREGKIFGTALYMSPEQARGKQVDARSDIFSFGTTLYEMVTGNVPFRGKTNTDTLSAITRDQPVPPSQQNAEVSQELERIISGCLEKDPQDRYLHTDQLASDLRKLRRVTDSGVQAVRTPSGPVESLPGAAGGWLGRGPGRRRLIFALLVVVAVLGGEAIRRWVGSDPSPVLNKGDQVIVTDFVNTTGREDLSAAVRDAFEQMLNQSSMIDVIKGPRLEEIITAEAGSMVSRIDRDLADGICRGGHCAGFVTGSIERQDEGYRLEISLYRPGSEAPAVVRSATVASDDGFLQTIFDLAVGIRRSLGEAPRSIAATHPPTTRSLAAYQIYATAYDLSDLLEQKSLFERALKLDPDFVEAYMELSIVHWQLGDSQGNRKYAAEAYSRSSKLSEQEQLWIEINLLDATYNFDKEVEGLKTYRRLYPLDADAGNWLGMAYSYYYEDQVAAEPHFRAAYETRGEPTDYDLMTLASTLLHQGKFEEHKQLVADFRRRGGVERAADVQEVLSHGWRGDWEDFLLGLDRLEKEYGRDPFGSGMRLEFFLRRGRWGEAWEVAPAAWREAVRSQNLSLQYTSEFSRAWLEMRRTGRPSQITPAQMRLVENSLLRLPYMATFSVLTGLEEPLAVLISKHEILEKDTESRFVMEELDFARACLALIRGDVETARGTLERLAGTREHYRRHHMLARAYEASSMWSEAASEYERALRFSRGLFFDESNTAEYVLLQYRLARIYERLGDTDRARHWYERFLTDWKDADPDIPELIEAKKRMAALGESRTTAVQ